MSPAAEDQRRAVRAACRRAELGVDQLWLRYFALGGSAAPAEVDAFLHDLMPLPEVQRDVLAHAVNERLDEVAWQARVPYSRTLREQAPDTGPLAALAELLEGSHRAAPEQLAAVCADAGRRLGVQLTALLVDQEQRTLVAMSGDAPPTSLDSTLAGRAFRLVRTVAGSVDGRGHLWLPVLDGVERLGVLQVSLGQHADADDPHLRQQCRWIAGLLGHLLNSLNDYGDELAITRRTRHLDPAAELIRQLLPPLTAGTQAVTVSGQSEPAHDVSGDAFDYALTETTASLAVFDARGAGLEASLRVAAALSGYRSSRRRRDGLYQQARTIDESVASAADGRRDTTLVSGVVAELDLIRGRLRYVVAGHPPPLLLRAGRVVRTLPGPQRGAFGLDEAELTIGEVVLEPGDWLVMHTDGITEARGHGGQPFAQAGLVDVLQRQASARLPAPETVRRLVHAVREHERAPAVQDATVLVAHWTPQA